MPLACSIIHVININHFLQHAFIILHWRTLEKRVRKHRFDIKHQHAERLRWWYSKIFRSTAMQHLVHAQGRTPQIALLCSDTLKRTRKNIDTEKTTDDAEKDCKLCMVCLAAVRASKCDRLRDAMRHGAHRHNASYLGGSSCERFLSTGAKTHF